MFSYLEDYYRFLAHWARVLLTASNVTAVYYIGSHVWLPANPYYNRAVPNFIVRTVAPEQGMLTATRGAAVGKPIGRARHDYLKYVDPHELRKFCAAWCDLGLTPRPLSGMGDSIHQAFGVLGDAVRIIEVPAGIHWAGPEYLDQIPNGISVEGFRSDELQRYNPTLDELDIPSPYQEVDETTVPKR